MLVWNAFHAGKEHAAVSPDVLFPVVFGLSAKVLCDIKSRNVRRPWPWQCQHLLSNVVAHPCFAFHHRCAPPPPPPPFFGIVDLVIPALLGCVKHVKHDFSPPKKNRGDHNNQAQQNPSVFLGIFFSLRIIEATKPPSPGDCSHHFLSSKMCVSVVALEPKKT